MSEENKAFIKAFIEEVWIAGNLSFIDSNFAEVITPHFVPPNVPKNLEGFKGYVAMFRSAIPDMHVHLDDLIAEGDKVVFRWNAHGTHDGVLLGIQPTGKEVGFTGMSLFRFEGARLLKVGLSLTSME